MIEDENAFPAPGSLREQHAELTRELILRAVAELLVDEGAGEFSLLDVARRSGVSLRTVYRYFPTRDELLAEAADWGDERLLGEITYEKTVDDLPEVFRSACERWDDHPRLARAMALSRAVRGERSHRREERLAAIHRALAEVTTELSESERRKAAGVLEYLESAITWVTMREASGLERAEVVEAIEWTMRALIEDLRRRNAAAGRHQANEAGAPRLIRLPRWASRPGQS